jgi:hypothetical protein
MTQRSAGALSAARHPAIRALASAILVVPVAGALGAAAALVDVLSNPLPLVEKILWTLFLGGIGIVFFLFGWYLSLLGHAVADLAGPERAGERP